MRDYVFGGERRDAIFPCMARANSIKGKNPGQETFERKLEIAISLLLQITFLDKGTIASLLSSAIKADN